MAFVGSQNMSSPSVDTGNCWALVCTTVKSAKQTNKTITLLCTQYQYTYVCTYVEI